MNIDKNMKYEGYLWLSDERSPRLLLEEEIGSELLPYLEGGVINPFVQEGWLYSRSEGVSYALRQMDGALRIYRFEVPPFDGEDEVSYLSNRMGELWLRFRQVWEEVPDPLCCDMGVKRLKELVFVGFDKER